MADEMSTKRKRDGRTSSDVYNKRDARLGMNVLGVVLGHTEPAQTRQADLIAVAKIYRKGLDLQLKATKDDIRQEIPQWLQRAIRAFVALRSKNVSSKQAEEMILQSSYWKDDGKFDDDDTRCLVTAIVDELSRKLRQPTGVFPLCNGATKRDAIVFAHQLANLGPLLDHKVLPLMFVKCEEICAMDDTALCTRIAQPASYCEMIVAPCDSFEQVWLCTENMPLISGFFKCLKCLLAKETCPVIDGMHAAQFVLQACCYIDTAGTPEEIGQYTRVAFFSLNWRGEHPPLLQMVLEKLPEVPADEKKGVLDQLGDVFVQSVQQKTNWRNPVVCNTNGSFIGIICLLAIVCMSLFVFLFICQKCGYPSENVMDKYKDEISRYTKCWMVPAVSKAIHMFCVKKTALV